MIPALFAVAMHWLVLNDIHLNPFDSRTAVVYGEDSNPSLFLDAVREMRRQAPDARVIVLGGDFLAHHFRALARAHRRDPYRSGEAAIDFIARSLNRAFPHAQFLVALGNNDDPCGDYRSEVGGPYAGEIARIFAPLVDRGGAAPEFQRDFSSGGYYTARLPGGLRAVVLDSVAWSFVYRGSCQRPARDAAAVEQRWLAGALATGDDVILMHIPPGFDAASTTAIAHRVVAVPFLSTWNERRLLATLEREHRHVAFLLSAHIHRYDFRLPAGLPMFIGSSLSPIYRNNPAFYELVVDGNTLKDVEPVVYDGFSGTWTREPSFDATYGTSSLDSTQLRRLSARIEEDPSVRERWIHAYDVWSWRIGDISDHSWQPFRCAQIAFGGDYSKCAGTRNRTLLALVFTAACALAAIAVVLLIIRRLQGAKGR